MNSIVRIPKFLRVMLVKRGKRAGVHLMKLIRRPSVVNNQIATLILSLGENLFKRHAAKISYLRIRQTTIQRFPEYFIAGRRPKV